MLIANEIGGMESVNELIKKYGKLLKIRKMLKSQKLLKSENLKGKKLAKSKKLSKSRNSPNFDAKKADPSFITFKARVTFNYLQLVFTKAPIF